jgi:hypothetical protein
VARAALADREARVVAETDCAAGVTPERRAHKAITDRPARMVCQG